MKISKKLISRTPPFDDLNSCISDDELAKVGNPESGTETLKTEIYLFCSRNNSIKVKNRKLVDLLVTENKKSANRIPSQNKLQNLTNIFFDDNNDFEKLLRLAKYRKHQFFLIKNIVDICCTSKSSDCLLQAAT